MDVVRLRDLLRECVVALKDTGTHEMLPNICEKLGLRVRRHSAYIPSTGFEPVFSVRHALS
jgi:hypothetical protein